MIPLLLLLLASSCLGQRRVIGDNQEQRISQQADIDERPERVYRRPPTYLILASRIVRPASIYQVIVSLLKEAEAMRVKASLSRSVFDCLSPGNGSSRNGVEVYGADTELDPEQSRPILLQVQTYTWHHPLLPLRYHLDTTLGTGTGLESRVTAGTVLEGEGLTIPPPGPGVP